MFSDCNYPLVLPKNSDGTLGAHLALVYPYGMAVDLYGSLLVSHLEIYSFFNRMSDAQCGD